MTDLRLPPLSAWCRGGVLRRTPRRRATFGDVDQPRPETPVLVGATSRPRVGPVGWWVIVLGALTTTGLAVLAGGLLVLHALAYGALTVVAPGAHVAAPDSGRHVLALAVGVLVHVATASAATWVASRTTIRTWRPVALGLAAPLVAAMSASCALLLTLGISPVAVLLEL